MKSSLCSFEHGGTSFHVVTTQREGENEKKGVMCIVGGNDDVRISSLCERHR